MLEKNQKNIENGQFLDPQYKNLINEIMSKGIKKEDRTGVGTISVFAGQIDHNMQEGFPLLTTKKMPFKTIMKELIWFLKGYTNIEWLIRRNCFIWVGDAYMQYLKYYAPKSDHNKLNDSEFVQYMVDKYNLFTKEQFINEILESNQFSQMWGDLGPIYGKQWRDWKTNENFGIDQFFHFINDLINKPDSRRIMVNAWNVGDIDKMTLPPCHYGFQAYTRKLNNVELESFKDYHFTNSNSERAISLLVNLRSLDVPLGLPFDIASYGALLEIVAAITNMIPERLIINSGDTHIYLNQIDAVQQQLDRKAKPLPYLKIPDRLKNKGIYFEEIFKNLEPNEFSIENYNSHPKIDIPLSN